MEHVQGQVSEAEEAQMRSELFKEVFEGEAPVQAAEPVEDIYSRPEPKPDALAKEDEITPVQEADNAFQKTLDDINTRLTMLDTLENRLKQTERRLGSVQNEVFNAKKVAETVKEAPTEAEMATAAKTDKAWNDLKEDFPEWAVAIEAKIAASQIKMPDVGNLRENLDNVSKTMITGPALERRLVSMMHPKWEQTILSAEYKNWLATQPANIQTQALNGETADEAVDVLNRFRDFRIRSANPSKIASARKDRLESSVATPTSGKSRPAKSEADMSTPELRQTIANEVWQE